MQLQTHFRWRASECWSSENFIAAPFAARLFGDFGAEVIKIERPGGGDELRDWRKTRGETSMLFRTIGRNKKSVILDLRTPEGQDAVQQDRRPAAML